MDLNHYYLLGLILLPLSMGAASLRRPVWGPVLGLLVLGLPQSLAILWVLILVWPLTVLFFLVYACIDIPGFELDPVKPIQDTTLTEKAVPLPLPKGSTGIALSNLSPSGRVEMNGEEHEALSNGQFIEEGRPVECIGHSLGRMKVAEVEAEQSRVTRPGCPGPHAGS